MAKFTVQMVQNPSDAEVNACAQLYCDLMKNDKAAMIMAGGDLTSLKMQAASVLKAGALAGSEYYKAMNEKGEMVGFTLWTPPGEDLFSKDEHCALGFTESIARLSDADQKHFKEEFMVHHSQFVGSHLGATGKKDAYWLHMAMVRSDCQRQGVFKSMFNVVCKKAASSGHTLACTTSCDSNLPVFLALGFTHKGTKVHKAPSGEWSNHLLCMNPGK